MILTAEKLINIDAIPKTTKLTPIMMDTNPGLRIGKIIKINPKTKAGTDLFIFPPDSILTGGTKIEAVKNYTTSTAIGA